MKLVWVPTSVWQVSQNIHFYSCIAMIRTKFFFEAPNVSRSKGVFGDLFVDASCMFVNLSKARFWTRCSGTAACNHLRLECCIRMQPSEALFHFTGSHAGRFWTHLCLKTCFSSNTLSILFTTNKIADWVTHIWILIQSSRPSECTTLLCHNKNMLVKYLLTNCIFFATNLILSFHFLWCCNRCSRIWWVAFGSSLDSSLRYKACIRMGTPFLNFLRLQHPASVFRFLMSWLFINASSRL